MLEDDTILQQSNTWLFADMASGTYWSPPHLVMGQRYDSTSKAALLFTIPY